MKVTGDPSFFLLDIVTWHHALYCPTAAGQMDDLSVFPFLAIKPRPGSPLELRGSGESQAWRSSFAFLGIGVRKSAGEIRIRM
jgi:hypothetical protein